MPTPQPFTYGFGVADNIDLRLPNAWKAVTVHARVLQPEGLLQSMPMSMRTTSNYQYSGDPPKPLRMLRVGHIVAL